MNDAQLIDLVHSYPLLYDKRCSDFKDKIKKYNAWTSIGRLLKCSANDCQHRWKYLRDKYSKERKGQNAANESGDVNKPIWEFLHTLSWLDGHVKRRNRTIMLPKIEIPELAMPSESQDPLSESLNPVSENDLYKIELSECSLSSEQPLSEIQEQDIFTHFIKQEDEDESGASVIHGDFLPSNTVNVPNNPERVPTPKRKRTESDPKECEDVNTVVASSLHDMGSAMKMVADVLSQKKNEDRDEDDLFGKLVASTLKKIKNSTKKKQLKKKIFIDLLDYSDGD